MQQIAKAARPTPEEAKALRAYAVEQEGLQEELRQERQARRAEVEREAQAEGRRYLGLGVKLRQEKVRRANEDGLLSDLELETLGGKVTASLRHLETLHKERIRLLEPCETKQGLEALEGLAKHRRKQADSCGALALGEHCASKIRLELRGKWRPLEQWLALHRMLGDRLKMVESFRELAPNEVLVNPLATGTTLEDIAASNREYTEARIVEGREAIPLAVESEKNPWLKRRYVRLANKPVVRETEFAYAGRGGLEAKADIPTFTQREARRLFRGYGFRGYKPKSQDLLALREELLQQAALTERLANYLRRKFRIRHPQPRADAVSFAIPLALPEANLERMEELCS